MPTKAKTHKPSNKSFKRFVPEAKDNSWREGKTTAQRGYGGKWQRRRKRFLEENPFCVEHLKNGKHVIAKVVDHIKPHRGNEELFWNEDNWQSLCKYHHDQKTGRGR